MVQSGEVADLSAREGDPTASQDDRGTECTLAVFRSMEEADEARQRLRSLGMFLRTIARAPLTPGRYRVEDGTLSEEAGGVVRGAAIGVPVGIAITLGMAAMLSNGRFPELAGIAVAGVFGGGIIGGFVGSIARAHFDDDVASAITVPEGSTWVLLTVVVSAWHAPGLPWDYPHEGHVKDVLKRAGAVAFLDPSLETPRSLDQEPQPVAA